MLHLTTNTFARPADLADPTDPAVLYARSYLLVRAAVGLLGILLPLLLIGVDALFLDGTVTARDSLSAYYHSGARDVFVGVLVTTGVLLVTYLAAQPRTWDFWLSLVAGVAVIGVALVPTSRPTGSTRPPTALQLRWGEHAVAVVHFFFAGVFILTLAALCLVFARRDARYAALRRARVHRTCGVMILVAVAWALLGSVTDLDVGPLHSLYLAEVLAVWSFGVSWLTKGRDLLAVIT